MPRGLIYTVAAMLLIALAPMPYAYYEILRIVVFGTFGYLSYTAVKHRHHVSVVLLTLPALIFNPIIPLHFDKIAWAFIDVSAAVALISIGSRSRGTFS
jgi:hypothetical protein